VSPVRYELDFYIPEDDILRSHRRENLKSYIPCLKISGVLANVTGAGGRHDGVGTPSDKTACVARCINCTATHVLLVTLRK
jgi:hypothetical protein